MQTASAGSGTNSQIHTPSISSQSGNQNIEFSVFARKDCVHCIALEAYLKATYTGTIQPKYYMLEDTKNYALYESFTEKNGIAKATPIILIGNTIIE
jgi:glutaredoxin